MEAHAMFAGRAVIFALIVGIVAAFALFGAYSAAISHMQPVKRACFLSEAMQ